MSYTSSCKDLQGRTQTASNFALFLLISGWIQHRCLPSVTECRRMLQVTKSSNSISSQREHSCNSPGIHVEDQLESAPFKSMDPLVDSHGTEISHSISIQYPFNIHSIPDNPVFFQGNNSHTFSKFPAAESHGAP